MVYGSRLSTMQLAVHGLGTVGLQYIPPTTIDRPKQKTRICKNPKECYCGSNGKII